MNCYGYHVVKLPYESLHCANQRNYLILVNKTQLHMRKVSQFQLYSSHENTTLESTYFQKQREQNPTVGVCSWLYLRLAPVSARSRDRAAYRVSTFLPHRQKLARLDRRLYRTWKW